MIGTDSSVVLVFVQMLDGVILVNMWQLIVFEVFIQMLEE